MYIVSRGFESEGAMAILIETTQMGPGGELVIPPSVREAAGICEGAHVALEVTEAGILLHVIDPDQAWFWTPEWLEGEREVDAEIAAGGGERFGSGEEFMAAMERDLKPLDP
jgi:bifunctional DNA-binding transcriptional regulator/antitoxin component of YhaV-PrlF toxin-antitoxin module